MKKRLWRHNFCQWCHKQHFITCFILYCRCGHGNNYSILWENYHNLKFISISPEKLFFFVGLSWFKFNNLGLTLCINLKFYTSVAKELKLKFREFWGNSYVCRSYRGKTGKGGGVFLSLPPILNRVNRVAGLKNLGFLVYKCACS